MFKLVVRAALSLMMFVSVNQPGFAASLALFTTQQEAQHHCPSDIVVWLNLPSGIYHFQGQRYYGNTKSGAYVCKTEADAAGDRSARNGQ